MENQTPHIFLDCDGVLADFDKAGELLWGMQPRQYEAKVGAKQFWRELENQRGYYTMRTQEKRKVLGDA